MSPFKLQAPTRVDIMESIGDAWAALTYFTIANGFRSVVDQDGEETDDCTMLVHHLDHLNLLDRKVGEVGDADDIVAAEIEAILADVEAVR